MNGTELPLSKWTHSLKQLPTAVDHAVSQLIAMNKDIHQDGPKMEL